MNQGTFEKIRASVDFLREFRALPKTRQKTLIAFDYGLEAPLRNALKILDVLERSRDYLAMDQLAAATGLKPKYIMETINALKQGGWEFQEVRRGKSYRTADSRSGKKQRPQTEAA